MSLIFFIALSMSVFFSGKLFVWGIQSINPDHFKGNLMDSKQINIYCLIGTIACILWSVIYHKRKR